MPEENKELTDKEIMILYQQKVQETLFAFEDNMIEIENTLEEKSVEPLQDKACNT